MRSVAAKKKGDQAVADFATRSPQRRSCPGLVMNDKEKSPLGKQAHATGA
jgi:hypothetical protein